LICIQKSVFPLLLILSGCVSGPDHKPPVMPLPEKFSEGDAQSSEDVTSLAWWTAYNDSKLDSFVVRGFAQNISILSSIEMTNAASSQVTLAGAGGLPSLAVSATDTIHGESGALRTENGHSNTSGGNLTASWLFDLFGQYRRARESALDTLDAAVATVDVTRLAYLQDLVTSYVDARYYQTRISIAREDLKSRRQTLALTQSQLAAGDVSRLDVVQAEGVVNSILSEVPGLEISYRRALNHIATLLNAQLDEILEAMQEPMPQPMFRGALSAGIPADLIRNRPDIRRAERQLAAAVAQVGVTEAQLFPSISLNGNIAPSYRHTSGNGGGLTSWSFGPTLNLPIFDGGMLRANVKIAESNARSAYLSWKATVLTAEEEVENALSAVRRNARTVAALRAEVESYRQAVSLSTANYTDGASSLLNVLDAQRSVTGAKESLAAAVQQSANDYVSLNVAIGAGYTSSASRGVGSYHVSLARD
jgi:outer membrane protein, multidrug efflux system